MGVAETHALLQAEGDVEKVELRVGECVALGEEVSERELDDETLAELVKECSALSVGRSVGVAEAHALLQADGEVEKVELRVGECEALAEEEPEREPDVETLAEAVRESSALSVG